MDNSSDEEFTPPSKRRRRSESQEDDKKDPSYRGNKAVSPSASGYPDYFPASQLFEYQWPLGNTEADYFMLQEQVKEFLDIRGIQRKYPDWRRRALEVEEREYLVGMGVVSETLSNMGLVALHSDEVLETMATDYPGKYSEYVQVLKEKEFQQTLRNKMIEARRMAVATARLESDELARADLRSGALKMVGQFNQQLTKQREVLTKDYIDPHTQLRHVPRSPLKPRPVPVKTRYPAALLPSQYSDSYPTFTPQELSQMPLNTVSGIPEYMAKALDPPPTNSSSAAVQGTPNSTEQTPKAVKAAADDLLKILKSSKQQPSVSMGGKQVSLLSSIQKLLTAYASGNQASIKSVEPPKPSSVSSSRRSSLTDLLKGDESGNGSSNQEVDKGTPNDGEHSIKVLSQNTEGESGKGSPDVEVSSAEHNQETKKETNNEETVSEAPNNDKVDPKPEKPTNSEKLVSEKVVSKVKKASAVCGVCRKGRASNMKGIPEELVQCTQCFTFVHPTCYKLPSTIHPILKLYNWQCLECKACEVCKGPHDEDKMVFCDDCDRGYHLFCVELNEVPSGNWLCPCCGKCGSCGTDKPGPVPESKWKHEYVDGRFIHTHCQDCSSYFRKGYYCPVCYKIYKNDHTDRPMVCCDSCDCWVHTKCDGISDKEYEKLSEENLNYVCTRCRNK